jgi:PKD repeat protein
MAGIKNQKWTISNSISSEANDIYYDDMWLTYIFQKPGYYTIKLDVEDTNGNVNSIERNMLKVK